ncbi:hypothetical protein J9303_20785 [Bacillaceae bacterium Marseille-Q3522]|nr:hypothetical protein [Bacillaceae bacterium Marseille-Q3522]
MKKLLGITGVIFIIFGLSLNLTEGLNEKAYVYDDELPPVDYQEIATISPDDDELPPV